jgi:carboxymethylenebutenolidase
MPGTMVEFKANGHEASGYLAVPASGKGPALVVLQEYWGLVPHITDLADRFAAAGFVALAPDLYHGEKTTSPDAAGKLFMALNIARAGADMRGAADYLLAQKSVTSKKAGILGFCMGGQLALYAGMEHPDRFSAVVDFYGIHPKVEIDPKRVRVPVLGHFGKSDASVPMDHVRELAKAVNAAGGSFVAYFYEAGHAFFNNARPAVYSKESAALAWERTLAFLKQHVR